MKHREIRKKLLRYIDGELPQDDKEEIQLHLEHCEQCRKDVQSLSGVWKLSQSIERMQPSPFLWNKISAQLEGKTQKRRLVHKAGVFIRQVAQPALTVAIVAMALFVGIQIGGYLNTKTLSRQQTTQTTNELQNEFGLQNFQLLTSGSLGGEMAALMNYENE